jgi:hypothetical protein
VRRVAGRRRGGQNLYRIENVSTKRAERITANEEERVRQGYEMQTTLQFAEADGKLQMVTTEVADGRPLLQLQYGPAATVWRMNFGWRRRKEKAIKGFMMNPVTGHWVGGVDDGNGEAEEEAPPDKTPPQRIVPYVEDRRNILIVDPHHALGDFRPQHAGHAAVRPEARHRIGVPAGRERADGRTPALRATTANPSCSTKRPKAVQACLPALATEPGALAAVAAEALEIMHFIPRQLVSRGPRVRWSKSSTLTGKPICEAGCYKCLLSYYNQPDHALIDRMDKDADGLVLDILCRLTVAASANGSQGRAPEQHAAELARTAGSSLEKAWLDLCRCQWPSKPDRGQHTIASANTCADFFYDD